MRHSLKDLLRRTEIRTQWGGVPCQTCKLPNAKLINAAIRQVAAAKAEGNPITRNTLIEEHLKPKYKYPFKSNALARHARACLGVEI